MTKEARKALVSTCTCYKSIVYEICNYIVNNLVNNECTKCRTLGVRACANPNLINGKYTDDFRQKTETEQKEACYLTSSCILGRI